MDTRVRITARAPSNIALIKYMGKTDSSLGNIPENPSLSLTLNSLCSFAEVARSERSDVAAKWIPELPRLARGPAHVPSLKDDGIARVLRHVERVRMAMSELLPRYGLTLSMGSMELRTANTFPASSGIASSASSFAAITLAVAAASSKDPAEFNRIYEKDLSLRRALARISRQGSGSSCRSFEGPWILWEGENAEALREVKMPELVNFVLLISNEAKKVSSSQAHSSVKTSPLWVGRVERANQRLGALRNALASADIAKVARIAWGEAWEMHSLFHTCAEPFSYWEPATIDALHWLSGFLNDDRPPIVTLDAGPNIHVMVPVSDADTWRVRLKERFGKLGILPKILEDQQGQGGTLL